ncbi:MAG: NUDIX hydrolase [Promethearchaeota archaeon]
MYNIERISESLGSSSNTLKADAAVVLIFKIIEQDVHILLVKRVENPSDPWSGQMALPGGKKDIEDRDLVETIVRETREETNVDLVDQCRFVGVMDSVRLRHRPMTIQPFVYFTTDELKIIINRKELEKFVWIPSKHLNSPNGSVSYKNLEYPAFIVARDIIWGLTYQLLKEFKEIIDSTL